MAEPDGRGDQGEGLLPGVNALILPGAGPGAAPLPLYRLRTPQGGLQAIAFAYSLGDLVAYDQDGRALWMKRVGAGEVFGGFDVDADGVTDLGLVRVTATGAPCYGTPLRRRTIDLVLGKDGTVIPGIVRPLDDICWSFGYSTPQWSVLAALFGPAGDIVLVPQYTSTNANALNPYDEGVGFVVGLDGQTVRQRGGVIMPSVPAFDAFPAALPEPHGSGTRHLPASHVPNGLIARAPDDRLVFFTSGRVVQYAMQPPFGLVADRPYLTANRTDLLGRNYGLVMPDPLRPERVALIAGTSAYALFADMRAGTMTADPWAGIERHVSVYDQRANTVDDRFFSYAHDGSDGFRYEGRTSFANTAWLSARGASASRLLLNVYQGGHWHVIVTAPGTTSTAVDVRDLFVWDARDLDGDGEVEVVASPARDPAAPDVPGYYFVKRRTLIMRWDETARAFVTRRTIEGALPWLVATFRDPSRSSSGGSLYPVLTAVADGAVALVLVDTTGARRLEPMP